ncbi:hypothetical protein [Aeromonas rivipollensis]|uniref:hypothetical protein n=1 Tax=Aeromonas rivipollensis TaxID=948519 RepID=UPI003CF67EE2
MQSDKLQILLMVLAQLPELLLHKLDNHLDHASCQVLADYPGTLLLVSTIPILWQGDIGREYRLG